MKNVYLFLFTLVFLSSCNVDRLLEKKSNDYYDVQSLLKEQLLLLEELRPQVSKTIMIDGEKEVKEITFDSIGWQNELDIFNLADINKPVLKDQYEAFELNKNGKRIIRYKAKSERLGISNLEIAFDKQGLIRKLSAVYEESNYLYSSVRKLELDFELHHGQPLISAYAVSGNQKMIMKDPVDFRITSNVLLDR